MNKKKIFGSIAVLAIAALAAFNVNINTQEDGLSDVSLNNVEALASETPNSDKKCSTSISSKNNKEMCSTRPVKYTTLIGTSYSCSSTKIGGSTTCRTGFSGTLSSECNGRTETINSVVTIGC